MGGEERNVRDEEEEGGRRFAESCGDYEVHRAKLISTKTGVGSELWQLEAQRLGVGRHTNWSRWRESDLLTYQ